MGSQQNQYSKLLQTWRSLTGLVGGGGGGGSGDPQVCNTLEYWFFVFPLVFFGVLIGFYWFALVFPMVLLTIRGNVWFYCGFLMVSLSLLEIYSFS